LKGDRKAITPSISGNWRREAGRDSTDQGGGLMTFIFDYPGRTVSGHRTKTCERV
jgi:hypothetical protein